MLDSLLLIVGYALLLLLLALAGLAAFVWQRRRLARRRAAAKSLPPTRHVTRHPIVLAHGWMGFDTLAMPGSRVHGVRGEYFRGVRNRLREDGHEVQVARVSPVAGIRTRALQLRDFIDGLETERVNIIAHSMGGLDARYAISHLGLGPRVASLTTLGTPHFGTPLADQSLVLGRRSILRVLLGRLGTDVDGIFDLTLERMLGFNAETPNMPGVHYMSYVGWVEPEGGELHRLLVPGFKYLQQKAGHNDGIVPANSQRWGEVRGMVHADHWAQIGWAPGFDVASFYSSVARDLAHQGH